MATIRELSPAAWRLRLREASFKGVAFHVEQQGRSSGRRIVTHLYPKRDLPYSEDMGRQIMRYQMVGYVIQAPIKSRQGRDSWGMPSDRLSRSPMNPADAASHSIDYDLQRDALSAVLDSNTPGELVDPYNPRLFLAGYDTGNPLMFWCERYTVTESRERGGYAQFEMSFVEAGIPGNEYQPNINSVVTVQKAADAATAGARDRANLPPVSDRERLEDAFKQRF